MEHPSYAGVMTMKLWCIIDFCVHDIFFYLMIMPYQFLQVSHIWLSRTPNGGWWELPGFEPVQAFITLALICSSIGFFLTIIILNIVKCYWQFRALADQLFRNPEYHKHVRRQVIKQVQSCFVLLGGILFYCIGFGGYLNMY